MILTRLRRWALAVGVLSVAAATAPLLPAAAAPPPGQGVPVTVMTRNLYLGADINRPLVAVGMLGANPNLFALLTAFGNANADIRTIVDETDFPARSKLLAKEIATQKPDLVGLQEAALWRTGPLELELDKIGDADATTVKYDFLATLLADLAALGTPYVAVRVTTESDVEAPAFTGTFPTIADAQDVRLTMRDVILRRAGDRVKVVDSGGGNYAARIPFPVTEGVTYTFIRGYAWADVRVGSKSFRFINTHLESESSGIALAQANELLAGPADVPNRPVVIVCDCNSDPLNGSGKATDPTPHWAPYRFITSHGFTDEWLQWKPADQGWTSGLSETVNDTTAAGFDHRIDMVFAHKAGGGAMPVDQGTVVGTSLSDRNADGLWPSDHGGVVLRLRP
jgi:endonuclease/exonuclease/phosphatase family metal-dependent hydrolase